MRCLLITALCFGLAAASAIQATPRDKKTSYGPSLATVIGTLGFLKVKAIFVTLIVFAIAAIFSKVLGGAGGGGGCFGGGLDLLGGGCGGGVGAPATAHAQTGYAYDTYGGAGANAAYNSYYNHRRSGKAAPAPDQGWDVFELSLRLMGLETDDCRSKFVCLADNEALDNPLLAMVLKAFGSSLKKYKDSDEKDAKEFKNCDKLYPKCVKSLSNLAYHDKTDKPPYHDQLEDKLPYHDDTPMNKLPYTGFDRTTEEVTETHVNR